MNTEKSKKEKMLKKYSITNTLKLCGFCILIGTVAGCVLWLFLRIIHICTNLLWDILPQTLGNPLWYPLGLCLSGGLIIGLTRKKLGDYPQSMTQVIGTIKDTGTYSYNSMGVLIIAAVLPLIFGSSVGPEAGMVGIIAALACWIGDNTKYAGLNAKLCSDFSMAISLSALFYSPLFGFFTAVESDDGDSSPIELDKKTKLLVYGLAIISSLSVNMLLNQCFGKISEGFPSFPAVPIDRWDLIMMLVYVICGVVLGIFFHQVEKWLGIISGFIPAILRETIAGILLGLAGIFAPVLLFSGEHEITALIEDYSIFAPGVLIALAFLKVILTNICIEMGLKGGHFFPIIYAAVCLGYGISLLVFPMDLSHCVFAAGITTAAALSVSIKKPLAVTCLLFICFPIKMGIPIFLSSILASYVSDLALKDKRA